MAKIEVTVFIDPTKFAKMQELTPEYEKGKGEKSKIVYFHIDTAIAYLLSQRKPQQNQISNREYLRR